MSQTESASAAGVNVLEGSSLLDQVLDQSKLKQSDEGYDSTRKGVAAFVAEMLKPNRAGEKLNANAVDSMIADLDRRLSAQIDQILHAPAFQAMESSWRGIKYLIDKTDFRENTLTDVITKLEPDLFKAVTGLTVKDFNLLVSLGVFNSTHMNQAVFAFRRYEDSSLSYTGIDSHPRLRSYGLYDTVVAVED